MKLLPIKQKEGSGDFYDRLIDQLKRKRLNVQKPRDFACTFAQ
jgi:hypothetical protein